MSSIGSGSVSEHLNQGWTIAKELEDETLELTRQTSSKFGMVARSVFFRVTYPFVYAAAAASVAMGTIGATLSVGTRDVYMPRMGPNGQYREVYVRTRTQEEMDRAHSYYRESMEYARSWWNLTESYKGWLKPFQHTYETKRIKDDRFSVSNRSTKTTQKISRVGQTRFKAKERTHQAKSKTSGVREEEE